MYFLEQIKKINKSIRIYVDMDGVIADYEFGEPLNFAFKRPIQTNIKTLEEISKLPNVSLYILSICKNDKEIIEKNIWLDKYAPFFLKDNRVIISKEKKKMTSKELKMNYLKNINNNDTIIIIDDDNEILKYLKINLPEFKYYQDSSIID